LRRASHHRVVDGGDAVVAHVQRGQASPQGDDGGDGTARLRPLGLPLGALARLRDQDRLEAAGNNTHTHTHQYKARPAYTLQRSVGR